MTDEELLEEVQAQRNLMITVATGGPDIQTVNAEYQHRRSRIQAALAERGIRYPNPYADLWEWYGKWSSGDLPSYQSRRQYIADLFRPLIEALEPGAKFEGTRVFAEPTGWAKVDGQLDEVRRRLAEASTEEQFQAVGILCRETLISLAQTVYDSQEHASVNGVEPSKADTRRMLEAYICTELGGSANEAVRRHASASLKLTVALQHDRTADFRQAALCAEATASLVNVIAILAGRRNPTSERGEDK